MLLIVILPIVFLLVYELQNNIKYKFIIKPAKSTEASQSRGTLSMLVTCSLECTLEFGGFSIKQSWRIYLVAKLLRTV